MNAKIIASLAFTSMFSLSTLLSPAHAEEQEKALNFGIISTESQQNLKPQWTPFLQDMEKKLGVKVNAFFAPDYAGIIQGMRFNKVDIAWYGNLSAMEAVDRANGQVFAQTVAADGSPGYWSVLIVNKDSPINNLNDLLAKRKDLTFGNGDPNSTSGFLVPGYYVFAKNNISASDFKRTVNAGHETNALAVANKQVDVATNNTENLDKLKTSAPEKLKELKVIWKSPLIPGDPIVWRKNLSETTKDKIYDFFMNYGKTPEEKAVLERLGWAPFRASSDLQPVPIRQLALFKEMQGVKSNKGLNEQDKLAKTTEIQAQLVLASELGRCTRRVGRLVAGRGNGPAYADQRRRQHGDVRRRLLPARFQPVAGLPHRNGRHAANRRLGHRAGGGSLHPLWPDERRKPGAVVGLPARSPPDGRLPRH